MSSYTRRSRTWIGAASAMRFTSSAWMPTRAASATCLPMSKPSASRVKPADQSSNSMVMERKAGWRTLRNGLGSGSRQRSQSANVSAAWAAANALAPVTIQPPSSVSYMRSQRVGRAEMRSHTPGCFPTNSRCPMLTASRSGASLHFNGTSSNSATTEPAD